MTSRIEPEEATLYASVDINDDDSVTIDCRVHVTIDGLAPDLSIIGRLLDAVRDLKEKYQAK